MALHDLFAEEAEFIVPDLASHVGKIEGNVVKRLSHCGQRLKVKISLLPKGSGFRCSNQAFPRFAVVDRTTTSFLDQEAVLKVDDVSSIHAAICGTGRWILPKTAPIEELASSEVAYTELTLKSWQDAFDLRVERYEGAELVRPGMRIPQVGAVRAVMAHWSVSRSAVTVVLPTGTGKTETMLALLVMASIPRLFVIVPTDQLRSQVAEKFLSLGKLKETGCLAPEALLPTVVALTRAPKSLEGMERLLGCAQVVVATMSVVSELSEEMLAALSEWASHLFVDEAHHIGAKTWRAFKQRFGQRPVLQFTATPYRNDGKRVDGKHIYSYPLRQAQTDGLFKPVNYIPVMGLDRADADNLIIGQVLAKLREDRGNGRPHLAMARVETIDDAKELHAKYVARAGQEFNPQLTHSKMGVAARREALRKLRSGESYIIVCVNMLGEGFDLPELKIAALHDKHKSEAITLQFVGRFTRTRTDLGDATVIANIAMDDVNERLKALYAEDADWNHLLNVVGFKKTHDAKRREDIITGLLAPPESFHVENLQPRMSTIIYRTTCAEWDTSNLENAIGTKATVADGPSINPEERLLILVTRDEEAMPWTSMKFPKNVQYNLIMAHWDEEQNLLFINTSRKKDLHLPLARALCGLDVQRLSGEPIFRVLSGFDRLMLSNLGLSEAQRKPVRYSMFMGVDIADQLNAYAGNRTKTLNNLFGQGFVDEERPDADGLIEGSIRTRSSMGCSIKGKIWSQSSTNNPAEWMRWCQQLGVKLLDDRITTENILRNLVKAVSQDMLPKDKTPLAVDWPEELLFENEEKVSILAGDLVVPFHVCAIDLESFAIDDGIMFRVTTDAFTTAYTFAIESGIAVYGQRSGPTLTLRIGKKERPLLDLFAESPPHVYLADGDMLVGASLFIVPGREEVLPFDLERIAADDWLGVDIRKESQGPTKRADSIQRRVITSLVESGGWDIVFDDDGSGEVADVVAMKLEDSRLKVHLFHCKYSSATAPGARLGDLYEICGQAQKSIRWAEHLGDMLKRLHRREADRLKALKASRYEQGGQQTLVTWINKWRQLRAEFSITLVQPGYSKRMAQSEHLELLAATQAYLMDTYRISMSAWFNE